MTTATIKTPAPPRSRRLLIVAAIVTLVAAVLFGLNSWMASYDEDQAPIWNCYTMGNHQCGPDSPWHGFYIGH